MRVLVDHYFARRALASPGIDELRWLHPAPGDVLRCAHGAQARVAVEARSRLVRTKVEALNQNGQVVMSMVAMNLFRCRNPN
jgi:acyl dehydratase